MPMSEAHKRATMKYDKENMRQIKFNLSKKYDLDIIARLDAVPNKQGYIKALIRADIAKEARKVKKIYFEASPDGNTLHSMDNSIRATVPVPEGASEDYGYLAMKNAILAAYHGAESLEFWYDGQEQYLDPDAAEGDPRIEIDD